MYNFQRIELEELDNLEYANFGDKLIFQTLPWIRFILETQKVEIVLLRITKDGEFIGYFTGFVFSRFGVKIIGSPFNGWTTCYMGFNVVDNVSRAEIIDPLWKFVIKAYGCKYLEITDRFMTFEETQAVGLFTTSHTTYVKDLRQGGEAIFNSFSATCKNQIRRAGKNGASLIERVPDDSFAELYYSQLVKVFGYQGLKPTYDAERVRKLLQNLKGLDASIRCTEARNPEGLSIGTCITLAYNSTCYLWGLAIVREEKYFQADYLVWDSFLYWQGKGCISYDLVGLRQYKEKFHPDLVEIPCVICSKSKILIGAKNVAKRIYWILNKAMQKR